MTGFKHILLGAGIGLFGAMGVAAAAVPGYTLPEANLRAGPGRDYPLITLVPPGRPTEIFGCVNGWGWCDVQVDGQRGWLNGRKLQVVNGSNRVGIGFYGPRFGLPVVQFDIGSYWAENYHDRPFFAEHQRWDHGHWNGGGYGHPGPGPGPGPRPGPNPGEWHRPGVEQPGGLGWRGPLGGPPPEHREPGRNPAPPAPPPASRPPASRPPAPSATPVPAAPGPAGRPDHQPRPDRQPPAATPGAAPAQGRPDHARPSAPPAGTPGAPEHKHRDPATPPPAN